MDALEIVKEYYEHFNAKNWNGMLNLLDENIRHEPNQGEVRIGLENFKDFLAIMDKCYEENLSDMVFLGEPNNSKVAVEFVVNGIYKEADEGLPAANNQKYVLPAGAFLEVQNGKICRVTTYYNLPLWIELVSK
ncbi:isopropylmalate/homocitrate/citramalate synthase [Lacihabitans sp. LS3-19]|uniref:nuclear transport factor 2 family protein n=1 Tax=Lacihabitans sp. LS3-19 TaxID=2487335 RepID=UPI0020CCDD27|nr:nuclear transport factor 2 family protein [Lacihabitans sp. LS3-19]MCP9769283.1 isopropylmalate/homocitrate/citramalate synthase [Lacihabitans sp. LS3-19]